MCGRFAQIYKDPIFKVSIPDNQICINFENNYNISPGKKALVITKERSFFATWNYDFTEITNGHTNHIGFNIRSENILIKSIYKKMFQAKSCLVPINGYYEWCGKQPYYIHDKNKIIYLVGLYQETDNGFCFATLTKEPNLFFKKFHLRQPVFLDNYSMFFKNNNFENESITKLDFHEVSDLVNSVNENSPLLIEKKETLFDW
ncbi:MAG: SOS response-associated peptidase family protein [Candidatus Delongbacteria bacterium]|nr:SOS response-associated peptidase family protein [Candidatus Delongbacteria bacterium]MBN2836571.1 SOS response-associated peptidase family protein [Candidatus Delongbacteria bacterium]